jgi:hypothetical protein
MPHALLQQRALQAKIDFWEETKNELVAEWQVINHSRAGRAMRSG